MAFDNSAPGSKTVTSITYDNSDAVAKTLTAVSFEEGTETTTFTADFTGTDGADVAAPWVIFPGTASILTILTNQAVGVGGPPSGAIVNTPTMADGFCSVATHGLASHHHIVIAREQSSGYNYRADLVNGAVTLYRGEGTGTTITLAGPVSAPFVTGGVLKIQAVGRDIRVSYNGVELITYTDNAATAVLSAGKWGISALTSASKFDTFRMGTVAVAGVEAKTVSSVTFDNSAPGTIAV